MLLREKILGGSMRLEVIRSIALVDVLVASGCSPDLSDKNNWKSPVGRITVTGQKYYCHDTGKGGGGAIDLTMLLIRTDFKGALAWLSDSIGVAPVDETARSRAAPEFVKKRPSVIPAPVDHHWSRVRHYLVDTRCLSGPLIDQLHADGRISADRFANAVFTLGCGQGAELRGTGPQKFHGVRGEKMAFTLPTTGPQKIAFVESAIDALSLRTLGFKGEVVSLTGNAAEIARDLVCQYRKRGYEVIAAFDTDAAGELMALSLGEGVERQRPPAGCKDWNEALCSKKKILFP